MTRFSINASTFPWCQAPLQKKRGNGARKLVFFLLVTSFILIVLCMYSFVIIQNSASASASASAIDKEDVIIKGSKSVIQTSKKEGHNVKIATKNNKKTKKDASDARENQETQSNSNESTNDEGLIDGDSETTDNIDIKAEQAKMLKAAEVACAEKKGIKKEFCISDVSKTGDPELAEDPFYDS